MAEENVCHKEKIRICERWRKANWKELRYVKNWKEEKQKSDVATVPNYFQFLNTETITQLRVSVLHKFYEEFQHNCLYVQ
jgi:hypothetical protein